ncbi:MAG: hypothetical protein A3J74_08950 [Elusimicrobia bacterium RIFCSPHIGHO2_02_FULL_57_9]|nr:MAG: hypothetical protein A3J74_08950 [Elusimicrobia bacterium RIFCSPHIGHO2_02_FULL_57_9]
MLTRDDLIDLILRHLRPAVCAPEASSKGPPGPAERNASLRPAPEAQSHKERRFERPSPAGRLFLSEYEIKKRLTETAQHLTIPEEAILSPLASDWLVLKGIKIIRE